jgi:hypothetical protein
MSRVEGDCDSMALVRIVPVSERPICDVGEIDTKKTQTDLALSRTGGFCVQRAQSYSHTLRRCASRCTTGSVS